MTEKLYTTAEAAEYIEPAVSVVRIHAMIKAAKFPHAQKRGRDWFLPKSDLDAENKRRKESPWID